MRGQLSFTKSTVFVFAIALLLVLYSCAEFGVNSRTFGGNTMGTTYMVRVVDDRLDEEFSDQIKQTIERELDRVNQLMSTYDPESELSRFNRFEDTQAFFSFSPETIEVFELAQRVSELSGGAFDITVGPLVNAWGFGPGERPAELPTESELEQLKQYVGYNLLEIEESGVRKSRTGVYCDLGAIAKGYGVDRVADALEEMQIENYLVEVGGEVRCRGVNRKGKVWTIGIEKPVTYERQVQRPIRLSNLAMATSGDYRNFYEEDGRRYSHTIDPRTGRPVGHTLASVSVIDECCAYADAMATALMVLGPQKGFELAEEQSLAAFFIVHEPNGELSAKQTSAFEALLE